MLGHIRKLSSETKTVLNAGQQSSIKTKAIDAHCI